MVNSKTHDQTVDFHEITVGFLAVPFPFFLGDWWLYARYPFSDLLRTMVMKSKNRHEN